MPDLATEERVAIEYHIIDDDPHVIWSGMFHQLLYRNGRALWATLLSKSLSYVFVKLCEEMILFGARLSLHLVILFSSDGIFLYRVVRAY
eukprot:CAMPEP_0178412546 /NCGR_PEP_ID=MMETSP0689_2-20121128/22070_1 /TAXON_ID=160604 /ORGANISM="Amphidinium massartii, Strain CS-259" /LENGTH=89 /DNA_ID=CAMNT_0020033795 /DNA_START=302 /DNA_END=571 /DNA_ORIENTATION=+